MKWIVIAVHESSRTSVELHWLPELARVSRSSLAPLERKEAGTGRRSQIVVIVSRAALSLPPPPLLLVH